MLRSCDIMWHLLFINTCRREIKWKLIWSNLLCHFEFFNSTLFDIFEVQVFLFLSSKHITMIHHYIYPSPHTQTKLCFSFIPLKILSPYWITILQKNRFCRKLKTDSGFCVTQCGHLIRFVLSSLSYCVLYGHNIAFLLGFQFYGSDIFIDPMGFFSDIEEAKFDGVLYWFL